MGHKHVRTIHGSLETDNFYKIEQEPRSKLREFFKTDKNFIIGFVFRNQLRKSVPNLLDGFKLFKSKNPDSKAKLLLHTHWSEGWDIPKLIKEKNIIFDNNLLEVDLCEWSGLKIDEIKNKFPEVYPIWKHDPENLILKISDRQ